MKPLEQEMKSRMDEGEIVKPNSGNLVRDIREAIEKYVIPDKPDWEKPLKFVVFSRRLDKGRGQRDFEALFKSIGAEIIDWNDKYEWFLKFVFRLQFQSVVL